MNDERVTQEDWDNAVSTALSTAREFADKESELEDDLREVQKLVDSINDGGLRELPSCFYEDGDEFPDISTEVDDDASSLVRRIEGWARLTLPELREDIPDDVVEAYRDLDTELTRIKNELDTKIYVLSKAESALSALGFTKCRRCHEYRAADGDRSDGLRCTLTRTCPRATHNLGVALVEAANHWKSDDSDERCDCDGCRHHSSVTLISVGTTRPGDEHHAHGHSFGDRTSEG